MMREQLEALERKWREEAEQVRRDPESFCNAKLEGYTETLDECADDLRHVIDGCAGEVEALKQELAAAREALVAAYDAGFMASGEGWNGEWGGDTDSAYYIEKRTENLATLQRDRQP